jgi:hypothetical protein
MAKYDKTAARQGFLMWYLPTQVNTFVSFNDLKLAALKERVAGECSQKTWEREINLIKERLPGFQFSYLNSNGRNPGVYVEPISAYLRILRKDQRPKTKSLLGQAVWNTILRDTVFEITRVKSTRCENDLWTDFDSRLAKMRSGGALTVCLDAGTTIEAMSMQLNTVNDLLGSTRNKKNKVNAPVSLPPRLQIVTTSLEVTYILCTGPHQSAIEIIPVGGHADPTHMSMSGSITRELFPVYAKFFNNCIAVVGATGYQPADGSKGASLLCGSLEEMFVKDSLLRMAKIRIGVFDSSKLKLNALPRAFSSLGAFDLVVTDDGTEETRDESLPTEVLAFRDVCETSDVACLIPQRKSDALES